MVLEERECSLTGPEFELAWTALGLQEYPLVLELTSHGETFDEHATLLEHARAGLSERGMWAAHGPTRRLTRLLKLLASPDSELDVRGRGPHGRWRALFASDHRCTVLAVHRNGVHTLTPVTAGSAVAAALSTLPAAPVGKGQLNAPSTALQQAVGRAGNTPRALVAELRGLGASAPDATALAEAIPTANGSAQIGAAARVAGHRRRAPRVVGVLHTEHGSYVVTERRAHDGAAWTTYAPATPQRMHQVVQELLSTTTTGVRPGVLR